MNPPVQPSAPPSAATGGGLELIAAARRAAPDDVRVDSSLRVFSSSRGRVRRRASRVHMIHERFGLTALYRPPDPNPGLGAAMT